VREEIRVHPPDPSAAIVQEIRTSSPTGYTLVPNSTSQTTYHVGGLGATSTYVIDPPRANSRVTYSRGVANNGLLESTKNILGGSRQSIHYKLDTPNTPVTTYVREYVETDVNPTVSTRVLDGKVTVHERVVEPVRTVESIPSRTIIYQDTRN
jgi:hypothetical protein